MRIPVAKRQVRNKLAQQLHLLALGIGRELLQQTGNCNVCGIIALRRARSSVLTVRVDSKRLANILLMKPKHVHRAVVGDSVVTFNHQRARRIVQIEQGYPGRACRVPGRRHGPGLRLRQTGIMLAFRFEDMRAGAVTHRE